MLKRKLRNSVISFGLMGVAACGGATSATPVTPGPKRAVVEEKVEAAPGKTADAVIAAPITIAEEALPTKVTSLFQFIGKDTPVIVNVPRLDKVIAALDPDTREAITKEMLESVNKESRFEAAVAKSLMDSFEGAVIFADPDKKKDKGTKAAEDAACIAAKFRDPKPVELVLSSKNVERNGPRFTASSEKDKDKPPMHGVWLADSGVIVGCVTREALSRSLAVATGALPSYATSPRFVAERANDLFVSVDMHPILGDAVEPGSDLFASLTTPGQSLGLDLRLNLYGASYPPVGSVIAPASQALVGQMPKGTIGALGVSLKRAPGKDLASVFSLIDKTTNGTNLQKARDGAAKVGIEFADIDAALGDELAVGIYRNTKEKIDFGKSEGLKHMAVIMSIAAKDENAHKKVWNALVAMAKKRPKEVSVRGDVLESIEKPSSKKHDFARFESRKGYIVFSVGDKSVVKEALTKFGKDTLASTPLFAEARAKEKPAMHVLAFLDGATLKALVADKGGDKPKTPISGGPAFLSLLLGPTDRGLELALGGGGAMDLIGTSASLAVNAFKAYTADAKTSEARMNVRFMASSARRAYERDIGDGKGPRNKLCKTSLPVPATMLKGTTHKTSMDSGGDWDSGDDNTGWKCVGYFSSDEIRYQYQYRQGSDYKGPKRGGPNPGPNGFEVSAEGDLDGNGKTSLFTRTGKIVAGKVVLDDDVFSSDPTE